MIRFQKIRWRNFLSTGNEFLELELDASNTMLVVGKNGAGKSQFLDALSFALFNKAYRKVNKGQLVNTIAGKNAVCEVEFERASHQFRVCRGIKPNYCELYQDGVLLRDVTDADIERLLGMNQKSFFQIVVLGAALYIPFMQLKVAERRLVVEDLLDLQVFATMGQVLKKRYQELEEERQGVESALAAARIRLQAEERILQALQEDTDGLIDDKMEYVTSEEAKIVEMESKIHDIKDEHDLCRKHISDATQVAKRIETLGKLGTQIEFRLQNLLKEIKFYEGHDSCPTCKQTIDAEFKTNTVQRKLAETEEVENGIKHLQREIRDLQLRQSDIDRMRNSMSRMISEANGHAHVAGCLRANVATIRNEIKKLRQKTIRAVGDMQGLKTEVDKNEKAFANLRHHRAVMDSAAGFLKDQGVRAKVIRRYLPVLNKLINKYLASMEFLCHLEVDDEFNETIKSRYRDEFSYESFSEGEKMRIDLAILFAWRDVARMRNSSAANLLVFDEVLDSSLDQDGADEFLQIVNSLTTGENVIVISHRGDQLNDKFTDVIRFEKSQGFSVMSRG